MQAAVAVVMATPSLAALAVLVVELPELLDGEALLSMQLRTPEAAAAVLAETTAQRLTAVQAVLEFV